MGGASALACDVSHLTGLASAAPATVGRVPTRHWPPATPSAEQRLWRKSRSINRKELIVVDDSAAPSSLSAYVEYERLHQGHVVGPGRFPHTCEGL